MVFPSAHPLFKILFDILLISIVASPIGIIKLVRPLQRGFFCDDVTIFYPYTKGTISFIMVVATSAVLNLLLILLFEASLTYYFEPKCLNRKPEGNPFFGTCRCPAFLERVYYYGGFYGFGAVVSTSSTNIVKIMVGRLRPHFMSICSPDFNRHGTECTKGYIYLPCTAADEKLLNDARLSFPSGHASFIWYSMIYAIMYMEAQMIWPIVSPLLKRLIQMFCVFVAMVVALSRISDYAHHFEDVIAGSLLGAVVALVICVRFVGLFRFPKQPFVVDGIAASTVHELKRRMEQRK